MIVVQLSSDLLVRNFCIVASSLNKPSNSVRLKLTGSVDYLRGNANNNNDNIYVLQLGCHPVAVVILHVNKT